MKTASVLLGTLCKSYMLHLKKAEFNKLEISHLAWREQSVRG